MYLHSVDEDQLQSWLDLGWVDTQKREHRPSVAQPIAVIEWNGEGAPPMPPKCER